MHSNIVIGCLSILGIAAGLGVTLAAELSRSQGLSARSNHWAFQPLKPGTPPQPRDAAWARNPIDSFILHRLEQEPLPPAPESGRATWFRRVTLDLTGLPPEPQALDAFLADVRTDAHERAVDELLRSPHYGERWAQHWLDVVRYADTEGFEFNSERPHAWPYRDYVIQAFNQHVPYDRFIREQIVGDLLGQDAATGFLVAASFLPPGQVGKDEPSKRLARQDALDEIVVNLGSTFLGLSAGCARCHDHKSDPISQRDYFRFQALVAGVEYEDRELRTPEAEALRQEASELKGRIAGLETRLAQLVPMAQPGSETVRRPAVHARMNVDRLSPVRARKLRFTVRATNSLEPCIDELEVFNPAGDNIALATSGARVTSSGDTAVADRHELCRIHDGHYGNSYSWRSNEKGRSWVIVEFADEHVVDRVFWGRDREGKLSDRLATDYLIEVAGESGGWLTVADATDRKPYVPGQPAETAFATAGLGATETAEAGRILEERKQLEARLKTREVGSKVFAGKFRKPDRIHLLSRGDPEQPQDEMIPAGLGILGGSELAVDSGDGDRRKALADFIASPSNPLTARVMANRIWQRHFGTGLVETPNDFGLGGARPSHPELLDWLAAEFIRSGWSIQHLHRLIVLSATYRQSSAQHAAGMALDAEVRLLWRYPARRLEAEAIRDSMLAVSGRLNRSMKGPGFDLFDKRGGLTGFKPVEVFSGEGLRRMIYAHKVRREREAVFGAFDCPDGGQSADRRRESFTPLQALNLFNSRFTADESGAFARRVVQESGADPDRQVRVAWKLALGREPSTAELDAAVPVAREHGLPSVCRVVYNLSEFMSFP